MNNKLFGLMAGAMLTAVTAMGQEAIPLVEWDFQKEYEKSNRDGGGLLFTPTQANGSTEFSGNFSNAAQTPYVMPDTRNASATGDFYVSGYSENGSWNICNGWETRVFRITNKTANPAADYSNPANHKTYFEVVFSTKGYKGIEIECAVAPGNNTLTKMEAVLSVDGGTTWADAGYLNTSSTWFTYDKSSISISANDKNKVILRLLPTEGVTNWNLEHLKISATEVVEAGGPVNLTATKATWPLDKGIDNPTGATLDNPEAFSVSSFEYGSNLKMNNVRTDGGISATQFEPINGGNGENNDENALIFTLKPKNGLTVTPKSLSFQASRVGTNGGKFDVGVTSSGTETLVLEGQTPALVKEAPYYTKYDINLTEIPATNGTLVAKIYIKDLAAAKQYAFQNVVLTVDVAGEIIPVPVYTFSVKVGLEGAGSVSCTPGGAEFDEGTTLTVKATENFGYHFVNWTDTNGKEVSAKNPYIFEIMANTALTANYTKTEVYALNVALEGGANRNQVQFNPEGHVVNGVHYYEEGSDVVLTALSNPIVTFTNWEDNTTSAERMVRMDGEKNLTANFASADYIVGWDLYYDQPNSQRAADFKAESDNAGLLSLRNAAGNTNSWLTRGVSNGAENGRWGARIWKNLTDGYYFEVSFGTVGYTNISITAGLCVSYNSFSKINAQWSADGTNFQTIGTYTLEPGWVDNKFDLPAEAAGKERIWVRYMPDTSSPKVGNSSDYDGLCIGDIYVYADYNAADDSEAPKIVSVIPADNSNGASATGSIIVTFDEKVKAGTGSATLNGETLSMTVSGKSVVFPYQGLAYNTKYTFTLPAGALTDRFGNASPAFSSSFTTMERKQPEARLYDAVVAADGSGDYTTVSAAIEVAPENRVTPWLIFVKNGEYFEHIDIPKNKPMLHFIGQDRDKAIILKDGLSGGPTSTGTEAGATVVVRSNDCLFENITLENKYGHEKQDGPQALALNTMGDRTVFNNVAMLSYQDTWITPSTSNYRAYVRNSFIEGAVDFIYNSGNLYIENTTLWITRKSGGYIVAPSHTKDVLWGYVFNNCTISAPGVPSETSVWLGRPWHNFPKTVFLNTRAEVTIPAAGWYETMGGLPAIWADWNTMDANGNPVDLSQRRDTYYYTDANGEKVYGTAKNHLTDEEAAQYTVRNVLSGSDAWEPVIKTEECATPCPKWKTDGTISWEAVPYAICYVITKDGKVVEFTKEPVMTGTVAESEYPKYFVQAVNEYGGLSEKGQTLDYETGIDNILTTGEETIVGIYDLNGRALSALRSGINIVRVVNADGSVSVRKIVK
ncbi:MAG: pectinesterase family protein [Muribaculaceae bacterium]|nr:pectinesterase family protein [Muribaculaceae bacterium]